MAQQLLNLRLIFLAPFVLLFTSLSFGQRYEISGVVTDSTQTPLTPSTVFLQSSKDSTVINYTVTSADGKFTLEGKSNEKNIDFFITYTGFDTYHKNIDLKEKSTIDLGDIVMKSGNHTLDEVLISAAPPIKLKKDTLEFNVSSFKTKENANLEDLLKKLPGVTVDNDGNIKINGKDVTKIKVNGKDFFGDDPKIATKNLPKDILEKVQVVDEKTKSEEFTGEESDSEDKMINLTIKEDNNKGLFARMTAGGGTDHRYSLNGIANYFKGDLRLSALGSSNNINSIGFSFDEIYDAMGRSAYAITDGGSNGGITKSQSGGIDFTNDWGETVDLTANYFYKRASTEAESKMERENILPNRRYFTNSQNSSKNVNNNHSGSVHFEYEPDTLTRIYIRPNIRANNGYTNSESSTESTDMDGNKLNNSTSEQHSEQHNVDFSNRISLTRKYGEKGGYYRVGFRNRNNKQQQNRSNYTSRNTYNEAGELKENKVQDQLIDEDKQEDEYAVDAKIRVPLSEKWKMDIDYSFTATKNDNERLLYETDENGDEYTILNEDLSSEFKSKSLQNKPRIGIVYHSDKLNTGLSAGLESIRLKNEEQFTETSFDNTYNNLFARFYMRYRINRMQSVYFRYRNSRSVPSISQLQPVTNTTNPLNIVTGNPDLKPALNNRFSLGYYNFNYQTHNGLNLYMSGQYTSDQVVAKTTTDEDLVRTTTYTNVDGRYNFRVGANAHKELTFKNKSTLKPQIGINSNISKDIGYSNGVKFHSNNFSVGPRVAVEYDVPDIINIEPSYNISYNQTQYSLNSQRDQGFADHNVRMRITSYWPENFIFGNDISYSHKGEVAAGFDNDFIMWNMSLGYEVWDGDGTFRVKVFDLLDQNISTRRATGQDYIQDTQQLVLNRYMMFSFTYKISKFGGKKSRRGGHFRRG